MKQIIKKILLFFYDLGLIPNSLLPISFANRLKLRRIFLNRRLDWRKEGYWIMQPMPTEKELDEYYENLYWNDRSMVEGVFQRCLDHYILIRDLAPDFFLGQKTFLNFGSGHGGISHLMWLAGHKVINIEPSNVRLNYSKNWKTLKTIGKLKEKVDFVYGSHSLEHVSDLEVLNEKITQSLNVGGFVFWEVPNGSIETNNGAANHVKPPHTYYFTTEYFKTLNFNCILNEYFDEGSFPNTVSKNNDGQVIRYLGNKV